MSKPGDALTQEEIQQACDRFIAAWGKMGSAWGISRTMAEVHALLYISGEALCTDDVMERLEISRGNASMSLRALQDWGIISRVHKRGDRKEYFEAVSDVWAMFKTIARERKKREIDPLIASLYDIRDMTGVAEGKSRPAAAGAEEALSLHNARLDAMLDFVGTLDRLASEILSPEGDGLREAISSLDNR
ncbi:MAG: ArsR family transcriptional regulator [Phycisphaerales bacterium]|nr:ArsR family transcriptional regulator [Phycisphaerales bacterium]